MGRGDQNYQLYPESFQPHISMWWYLSWTYVHIWIKTKKWRYQCTFVNQVFAIHKVLALSKTLHKISTCEIFYQTYMSCTMVYIQMACFNSLHDLSITWNDFIINWDIIIFEQYLMYKAHIKEASCMVLFWLSKKITKLNPCNEI